MNLLLTEEGKVLYQNLENYTKLRRGETLTPPPPPKKPKKPTLEQYQVDFFITELEELRENSRRVVIDCDKVLSLCTTADEYLKNDCKVARMIHGRLVERYTRLLNYQSALQ